MVEVATSGNASLRGGTLDCAFILLLALAICAGYPRYLHGCRGLPGNETGRPGRRSLGGLHTYSALRPRCISGFQCLENFVRSDGSLVDAYANGIEDGVGDGRNDRVQRSLSRLFASKGAFKIRNFDEDGFDFRRVKRCGKFVVQQRWNLMSPFAEDLLLHDRLSRAHVRATLNLAGYQ